MYPHLIKKEKGDMEITVDKTGYLLKPFHEIPAFAGMTKTIQHTMSVNRSYSKRIKYL